MMINDDNKKRKSGLFSGRAIYIALGLCVLAAGIIGYTSSMKLPEVNVRETLPKVTSESRNESTYKSEKVTVDMFVTEVPSVPDASEEPKNTEEDIRAVFGNDEESLTDTVNKPPEKYSLPLSADMGADFSMGVPVYNETMGDYRTHNGVDFVGKTGDAVKTIAPGRVIAVQNDNVKGNSVTVDHGGGVVSEIWGLADEGLVSEGDEVSENSIIGLLGVVPCETKSGEHIHLEIRINGELFDPLEIMGFDGAVDE